MFRLCTMEKLTLVLLLLLPGVFCDLPTDFTVTSYDLSLIVPSSIKNAVEGNVTIKLSCNADTSAIVLHWGSSLSPANPSTTDLSITYTSTDSGSTPKSITGFTPKKVGDVLTITTPDPITKGGVVAVFVVFKATINADNKGLFYRQYLADNNQNNTVLMTNLRPTYARELFPCLDEPKHTATLTLKVTYPSSWKIAATTDVSNTIVGTTGTTVAAFKSIDIPANTFALFLADNMTQTVWGVDRSTTKLSFWSRKGLATSTLSANIEILGELYYMVEDLIGITLPETTRQLSIVMVPGLEEPFAGYGIIFIREYEYAQDYSSPQKEGFFKDNVAPIVELFLRQFTEYSSRPSKWSDYWVCRAIAKYFQYIILYTVLPGLDFKTDMEVVARQTALFLDSQPDAKALQDLSVSTDLSSSVIALVNDPLKSLKGAVILNMLDQSLPAGTVMAAIKTFLANNQNKMFTSTTFYTAIQNIQNTAGLPLSENAKKALKNLNSWFSSSRYPLEVIKVYQTGTPGIINFTTTGFCSILNPSCTALLPSTYYVSATVATKSDNRYFTTRQDIWANNEDTNISTRINVGESDWMVANMKSGGYYRSSYDTENWEHIISALVSGDNRLLGRSQMLDDAFALALSLTNALDYNITLRLSLANFGNTLYGDWVPVHRGLRSIQDNLLNLPFYSSYKKFSAGFFLNLNGFLQNRSSDPFEKARIQALFLEDFCEYDIAGYRASSVGNLTDLLQGLLPNTVPSSAYDALVCCGARFNSTLKAQTLWDTIIDSRLNYYNRRFASIALGCLSNYTDASQFYNKMISADIQLKHYNEIILKYLAEKNPINFLTDFSNLIEKFQTRLDVTSVASLILRAGRKVNNNTQAAVLDAINNNANVDVVVKTTAKTTMNIVSSKVTWLATNNATLVAVLQSHTLPSGDTSSANMLTGTSFLVLFFYTLYTLTPL